MTNDRPDQFASHVQFVGPIPGLFVPLDDDDIPSPYCPKCNSCNEPGCCKPTKCEAVRCLYGDDSVRQYEEALEESAGFYVLLEKLGIVNPFAATGDIIEAIADIKVGDGTLYDVIRRAFDAAVLEGQR